MGSGNLPKFPSARRGGRIRVHTHIFVQRYVACTVLGVAIVIPALMNKFFKGDLLFCGCIVAALVTIFFAKTVKWRVRPDPTDGTYFAQGMSHLPPSEPILITNSNAFVELAFYAPPALSRRLVFLNDAAISRRYLHYDTNALILPALSRRTHLNVVDFDTFVKSTPRFAMLTDFHDGIFLELLRSKMQFTPLAGGPEFEAFQVEAPSVRAARGTE